MGWLAWPLLVGGLWVGLLVGIDRGLEPDFDEGAWLRWLRKGAEHPLRSGLAAALLALAWGFARAPSGLRTP